MRGATCFNFVRTGRRVRPATIRYGIGCQIGRNSDDSRVAQGGQMANVSQPSKEIPNQAPNEDVATEPAESTEAPKTYAVTLVFDTEKGVRLTQPKRHPIVVSTSLARVLVRAASLALTSEPPLQFSTLLIAMLVDEDKRVDAQLKSLQVVNLDAIARKRTYNEKSLRSLNEGTLK